MKLVQKMIIRYLSHDRLHELNIPITRSKKDKTKDTGGGKLLNLCKSSGLLISRVGSDKHIDLTICKLKTKLGTNKNTIDYAIASQTLFNYIQDFHVDILDPILSDVYILISITLSKINKTT